MEEFVWIIVISVVVIFLRWVCLARKKNDEERDVESGQQSRNSGISPYPIKLVQKFDILAMSLRTYDEYLEEVDAVANKIWQYLLNQKSQHGLKIDRYKTAGSVGKGTCISYTDHNGQRVNPDLDMVIFINLVKPPFTEQLKIFANFLRDLDEVSGVKERKYSIEFKMWTRSQKDIKVDLLAARNVVDKSDSWRYEDKDIGELEASMILKDLDSIQRQAISDRERVKENKLNSSALAEKTVQIISDYVKDPYVKKVVRICKYWNCRIDLDKYGYVPARSCIMELIAIYCQRTAGTSQQDKERDLISGFRRFLEEVSNFSNLDISLNCNNDEENCGGPVKQDNKPMVRDPVNNWNNLAEGIPDEVIGIWQDQAKKTLSILRELRNDRDVNVENDIDEIFRQKVENHTVLEIAE